MNKQEFLAQLESRLRGLPSDDREERLAFYSEMIDDRVEDGLSQEEAVQAIGTVDDVVEQILCEIPLARLVKETVKPKRRMKPWEIVLIAVGSPVWFPLAVSAAAVILALFIAWWAILISFFAVFAAVAVCGAAGLFAGALFLAGGHTAAGIAMIAAALVCAGLAILLFLGCKAAAKGSARLTKAMILGIKRCFVRKEAVA